MRAMTLLVLMAPIVARAAASSNDLSGYGRQAFELPNVGERIVPADFDGDGLTDLLCADGARLRVYFQRKSASDERTVFNFGTPDAVLELPGSAVGWNVEPNDGAGARIVALVDGRRVLGWSMAGRSFSEPVTVLTELAGYLPAGAYPLEFVRDVDGKHGADIIVPAAGDLHLYLRDEHGDFGQGLRVASRMDVEDRLVASGDLAQQVGQRVYVPQLRIRDLNADGRPDLVSRTDELLEVFLARADGAYPQQPSYRVDIGAIEKRVGSVEIDNIDFSNLTGLLAHTYEVKLEDVDGDGVEDLLIREGGKISFFAGSATGMALDAPRQILKSSGNVLTAVLRDENEDGLKDLWLMRVENVSLGNVFLWLAVSGAVDVEVFIYVNEGERFASRPSRKLTVSLKFPSVLKTASMVSRVTKAADEAEVVRTASAHINRNETPDLLVLRDATVLAYLDVALEREDDDFLGLFDYRRDRDNYVLDLGELLDSATVTANKHWRGVKDRSPDFTVALGGGEDGPDANAIDPQHADIVALDLNADGRDDIFAFLERDAGIVRGMLLLSE